VEVLRRELSPTRVRVLALGGIIGPAAFISAWAACAAATAGYSSIDSAISDLARIGASTRVGMTTGFVVFGIGVIAFGLALRDSLQGPAWMAAVATATCTLGVAAFPLGGWAGDGTHAAFAGAGYVSLVALPLLAARPLAHAGRARAAALSISVGVASGVCLAASTLGPAHGLWQRLGLTVGDVWIVTVAARIAANGGQTRYGAL
jgi:hypothetical membrane protein